MLKQVCVGIATRRKRPENAELLLHIHGSALPNRPYMALVHNDCLRESVQNVILPQRIQWGITSLALTCGPSTGWIVVRHIPNCLRGFRPGIEGMYGQPRNRAKNSRCEVPLTVRSIIAVGAFENSRPARVGRDAYA